MNYDNQINLNKTRRGSFIESIYKIIHAFSLTEKVVFAMLALVAVISGLASLSKLNNRFLVAVPDYGGTITEGILGVPRFVNPVLATSDADKDITSLVFSGLLKLTPNGVLAPDLAENYEISSDGKTYTFTLREDIYFHDGEPVTTDDIEFTIQRIQDPTIKSPKRPIWEGMSVQKISSRKVSFTLKQAYAPFLDNFTIGILPKHIWKEVPTDEFSFSELNANAIGSGPYSISKIERNSYGLASDYELRSFSDYALGQPFVKNLGFKFFQNESDLVDSFNKGDIDAIAGVSPGTLDLLNLEKSRVIDTTLPRVFGVFFNQNQSPALLNKEVREALNISIDKEEILEESLLGHGKVIDSPVPFLNHESDEEATSTAETLPRVDRALSILTKAGWVLNPKTGVMEKTINGKVVPLSFSLATSDSAEFKSIAEIIIRDWRSIGASVELKVYEIGDLNQNTIRPRKFDALLFGEVVGRELDLYPFWHSSQRNDPGLNIALYTNSAADKILESLRSIQDKTERTEKAAEFEEIFKNDLPAIFIYSPDFIYVVPKNLQNVSLSELSAPSERFLNVNEWYIETNKVWKVFAY